MNTYIITYITSIISGIIIAVISGRIIAVIDDISKSSTHLITMILVILIASLLPTYYVFSNMVPSTTEAQKIFSDFNRSIPINNYGFHWGIFSDNPYNGDSYLTVNVRSYADRYNDGFAEISYHLGDGSTIPPYCGIMSGFSARPSVFRDVSKYSGIRFEAWYEGPVPDGIEFYITLATQKYINSYEADFRFNFTKILNNKQHPESIVVPFDSFKLGPYFPGDEETFGKELQQQLYQVAFIIVDTGTGVSPIEGSLCIDNIEFF